MTRRVVTYVDCDRCGAKALVSPSVLTVTVGFMAGPAGQEERCETVDMCQACLAVLGQKHLETLTHGEAKTWLDNVREHRRLLTR